jgi:hypothetical protein
MKPSSPPLIPPRPDLPVLPFEAAIGVVCACGEAWFVAYVAIRDDYVPNMLVEPVCASCGTPAPPAVERVWRAPKVT